MTEKSAEPATYTDRDMLWTAATTAIAVGLLVVLGYLAGYERGFTTGQIVGIRWADECVARNNCDPVPK